MARISSLGDFVRVRTGKLDANAAHENGKYPFFTCSKEPLAINTYSFDCECVLLAGNGEFHVSYYSGPFDAYQRTYVIESLDVERLSVPYLYYFMRYYSAELRKLSVGGVIKFIKLGNIKDAPIPMPTISEQRRIVDLLSRAEGIVCLRREAEKKAAELIPALFLDMFGDPATNPMGWPMATVGSVLDAIDYGSSSKATSDGAGLPMIRMGNVTYEGNLDLADLKYVDLPEAEAERYALHEGDILFNRTNSKELVGKTGLWDGSCAAIVASYFIRLRVLRQVLSPHYLWAFMNTLHMKRVIFDTARGAIGQSNINSKELKAFPLAVPPLSLQEQFSLRCADVSGMAVQQSTATAKAQATFDALLAKTFSN